MSEMNHMSVSEPDGRLIKAVAIVCILSPLLLPVTVTNIPFFNGIPLVFGTLLVSIAMGAYFVGPLICCIFLALSKVSLSDRLACAVGLSLGWFLIYVLGIGPWLVFEAFEVDFLFAALYFLLAIVLPFLVLRSFWGWQIFLRQNELPTRQNLKVSDLMCVTAIVALGLAVPQLTEYWSEILFASLVLFGFSLIILVPFVYLMMRQDDYWVCLAALCFAIGLIASMFVVGTGILDARPVITSVSAVGTFGLALIGIRFSGSRLVMYSDIGSLSESPTFTSENASENEKDNDPFR